MNDGMSTTFHNVEGPTFLDFKREDQAQYEELPLAFSNLLYKVQSEQYKYFLLKVCEGPKCSLPVCYYNPL